MNRFAQMDLFEEANRRVALRDRAETKKQDGMSRVIRTAEKVSPGWTDRALDWVRQHALIHEEFLAEEVPLQDKPPDGRAMGTVMQIAARKRIVEACGTRRATSSNNSWKTNWKSLIFQGKAS